MDWLLELLKHMLHAVGYLGEAETKLSKRTLRKANNIQLVPCIYGKYECDTNKGILNDGQVAASVDQPPCELSAVLEEDNRIQVIENQTEEIETIGRLKDIISGRSQESSTFMEDQIMSEKPIRVPSKNTADCHMVKSSTKTTNIDLEDIPGNTEKEATVANKMENVCVQQPRKLLDQEILAEITEIPKEAEYRDHQLIAKTGKMAKDDNQMEKSNKYIHGDQESVAGFPKSGNVHPDNSTNLLTSKLEAEDTGSDWVSKR